MWRRLPLCRILRPGAAPVLSRCVALGLALVALLESGAAAQGPVPPCGGMPQPAYPAPGEPVHSGVWTRAQLGDSWSPPGCTVWTGNDFRVVVALAGRIPDRVSVDELLARFGSVSRLAGLRYWSASERQWRDLVTSATAVQGPADERPRADFSPQELRSGRAVYFLQSDNRSTGGVLYRMTVLAAEPDRIVVAMENVTSIRLLLLTLFPPGSIQTVDFLERQADGSWGYYSLTRTRANSSFLTGGFLSSYVNRATAFYRHIAGAPEAAEAH